MSDDLETRWEQGLASGRLAFPRCAACGAWNWYPLPQCSRCQSDQLEWAEVAPLARIYSWTRAHYDFLMGGALAEPAVIALVEIADAPEIRLPVRQLAAGAQPVIGEMVHLEVAQSGGRAIWCYAPLDTPATLSDAP